MNENEAWFARRHEDPDYLFELLAIDLGEHVVARMEELGINRTQLAERMGVSRARISQVLRGDDNLTLKTLVAVAHALDTTARVVLAPRRSAPNTSGWRLVEPLPLGEARIARRAARVA